MTQSTEPRRARWLDTETRTCDTCGQQYEALVIHIFDTCEACSHKQWAERKAAVEAHATERGYTIRSFGGACPYQAEGVAANGRPFYFRARHGAWTLRVGPVGAPDDYGHWCDEGELIADGPDPANGWPDDADVLPILDAHLSAEVSR